MSGMKLRYRYLALAALTAIGCQKTVPVKPEAKAIHDGMYVFDLHVDSPMVVKFMDYDFGERHSAPGWFYPWKLHTDLPRMQEGGLNGMLFGIVVNPRSKDPTASVERQIKFINEEIAGRYPDKIVVAESVDDFLHAHREGKIAYWLALEGAHELGNSLDLEKLVDWYGRGVRSIGLAHFTSNEFAASSADKGAERPGLTPLGRRLICEANRMGIVIDLAHTHPVSFFETLELTQAPVIVSHTGVASQNEVFRNLSDDQIRAVAKNRGAIGVMLAGFWLNPNRWASIDDLLDHIDVVRDVGGIDALAFGSDFDGFIWTPRGIKDVADLPVITQAMLKRGYSEEDLRKFWGENVIRVFRDVEMIGRTLRESGATCD